MPGRGSGRSKAESRPLVPWKREVEAYPGESDTGFLRGRSGPSNQHGDSGGASRFYAQFQLDAPFIYHAKASKGESTLKGRILNNHPTRKPVGLMRYLVRLVTPKGGVVLDPYLGSGTTAVAAIEEGMSYVGIELDPQYVEISRSRLKIVEESKESTLEDLVSSLPQE